MEEDKVYYCIVNRSDIKVDFNDDRSIKKETREAHYVLGKLLEKFGYTLPEVYYSSEGKPYFKDSKIFFNYAHTKRFIAIAISLKEVGIDIEENRDISDGVARKYLDNIEGKKDRLKAWVKKEAYSKFKGLGLGIGLSNINLDMIDAKYFELETKEYFCAICCDKTHRNFTLIKLNEFVVYNFETNKR